MSTNNNQVNSTAAVTNNLPAKIDALKNYLQKDNVQDQLKNAWQDNAGSFIASLIDLYARETSLQSCRPEEVAIQALRAAVLKLPIVKGLGFAFILPFKKGDKYLPEFIIGYKGLIQLALRTGQYRIIHADKVYEGEYKTKNKLTGEFDLTGEKKSDLVIGYFAHFEMLNGFSKTFYMTVKQVQDHASKYSKSYNTQYSPWKTEFDKMSLKTVIRGLLGGWGYLSVELMDAITDDDKDVAEDTLNEIHRNGNKKDLNFSGVEEAEQVAAGSFGEPGNTPPF